MQRWSRDPRPSGFNRRTQRTQVSFGEVSTISAGSCEKNLGKADFGCVGVARRHAIIFDFISRTASFTPVNNARLTMLCPILSSWRCGTVRTSAMFT
jgi:hypothetical protein